MATDWYRRDGEDLLLSLHVQPQSTRDCIDGLHGNRLKIRITTPPVEGKANAHLQIFLAELFGIARRRVQIESGTRGRSKRARITDIDRLPAELAALQGTH